ncbi:hypothetical protein PN36_29095 [Candidatus Thiomargarita nelsonii]|uniref:Uncharacterized protein n=1 Tax=Candidatus Thiomargarita nelsonii TaxID=1003181 RepID=A0A0A6PCC5_9GAMM|nr:hypothetical protein PN36_29095 [Candidatus Thiomargarita nelsonii]
MEIAKDAGAQRAKAVVANPALKATDDVVSPVKKCPLKDSDDKKNTTNATDAITTTEKGKMEDKAKIGTKISQKQLRHIKNRKEWIQRGKGSYMESRKIE